MLICLKRFPEFDTHAWTAASLGWTMGGGGGATTADRPPPPPGSLLLELSCDNEGLLLPLLLSSPPPPPPLLLPLLSMQAKNKYRHVKSMHDIFLKQYIPIHHDQQYLF
jgi:hypothetical protein